MKNLIGMRQEYLLIGKPRKKKRSCLFNFFKFSLLISLGWLGIILVLFFIY